MDDVEKVVAVDDSLEAITRLGMRFRCTLESSGVAINQLKEELRDMIPYVKQFNNIAKMDYGCVW